MIPQNFITQWSNHVPWQSNEQIEQDLVISRALVVIFNDDFLSKKLAFRGGTALHKLYVNPQPRYSEDIDLVQIEASPFGEVLDRLSEVLKFIDGKISVDKGDPMITMVYKFESEIPPINPLRLKIETNCREHIVEMGWEQKAFAVNSDWFKGECNITTYKIEELLGTKFRALYQRRKGRDLYDLHKVISTMKVDTQAIVNCFKTYIKFSTSKIPSQKEFIENMEAKIKNENFIGDITALLRTDEKEKYNQQEAYELIKAELISKI